MPHQAVPANGSASTGSSGVCAYDILRWALGVVLLAAAGLKVQQAMAGPVVEDGRVVSRVWLLLHVEFEVVLGLWLLSGLYRRLAWLAAAATFLTFAVVTAMRGVHGAASCGCFGKLSVGPWYAFGIDVAAVVALIVFRPRWKAATAPTNRLVRRLAVTAGLVVLLGVPAGLAVGRSTPGRLADDGSIVGNETCVVVEPAAWVGKTLPLKKHISTGTQLSQGEWTVVLFHHDCEDCKALIDRLAGEARKPGARRNRPRLAVVEIPKYGPLPESLEARNSAVLVGKLDSTREWFVPTPTVLELHDGVVTSVREGTGPVVTQASTPPASPKTAAGPETPSPGIAPVVVGGAKELGFVEPGSSHEVAFELSNPADVAMPIRKVASECPCLTVLSAPESIGPKSSATVKVRFVAPEKPTARYAKRLMVTAVGASPVPLQVIAEVGIPLEVRPAVLELGTLIEGEQRQTTVTLVNRVKEAVMPLYASSSLTDCIARIPRATVEPGGSLEIPVEVCAPEKPGTQKVTLTIKLHSDIQPEVRVPVTFNVSSDYRVTPGVIDLGIVSAGEHKSVAVTLIAQVDEAGEFVQSAVLEPLTGAGGEVKLSHAGRTATVACDLVAGDQAGAIRGQLRLTVAGLDNAVLVPIVGRIRSPGGSAMPPGIP